MTTNHIDQLTEWWETADQVAPMRGDLVIENVSDEDGPEYRIRKWPGDRKEKLSYVRVLEPKPKPAWHDAVAVLARSASEADQPKRAVWTWDAAMERWYDEGGCHWANTDDLRDVTPLIEAKVTDETQDRVWRAIQKYTGEEERYRPDYAEEIDAYARAALGLDPA